MPDPAHDRFAWVRRCAHELIVLRPDAEPDQALEAAADLWETAHDMEPEEAAGVRHLNWLQHQ